MLNMFDCRGQWQELPRACRVVVRRPIKAAIGDDSAAVAAESVVFDD